MRKLKYFFAIAGLIMFCGADTHWGFALLGAACLGAVISISQMEIEELRMIRSNADEDRPE